MYEDTFDISQYSANGAEWENVSLPHTYNQFDTFDNYEENAQNGERSMYTGTAWYKKTITVGEDMLTKSVIIEFEGARQACKIWVNGTEVGDDNGQYVSENGFIPFGVDVSSYLKVGTNSICVLVNNSAQYVIEGTNNLIPWNDSHWQPTLGGLYRNVNMYVLNKAHFTLPLYSFLQTQGTYVYTRDVSKTSATIHIDAEVENKNLQQGKYKIIAEIYNANGTVVDSYTNSATLKSEEFTLNAKQRYL